MKDDRLYLIHIRERIERIENYIQDGRETFMTSQMHQDAIIRNFEVLGEAAKRISKDTKQANPQIPWRQVAGFRDVLIHDYIGIDLDETWNIIENDLPPLKAQVTAILASIGD